MQSGSLLLTRSSHFVLLGILYNSLKISVQTKNNPSAYKILNNRAQLFRLNRIIDYVLLARYEQYMCKSTEMCDKTRNMVVKIFFRAHLATIPGFSPCINKRNSWLNRLEKSALRIPAIF